ncbi:hypothetical protein SAMN05421687_11059 [Salimicrobium flavidum]|uniref:Uncharacterized protein n=2 Tax=Salimicrobium flavidum TaxID=570947 RepID=A0A1N7KD29_9BACI|nr:hypothetical protein SAMN05421687_11059 [Salimicrobium flavidum]
MLFSVANQEISRGEDIQLTTNLAPKQSLHYEATFTISKKGTYNLIARTSSLEINGQMIDGKGNKDYIEEDMSKTFKKLEKAKLSLDSMKIEVVD